MTQSPGALVLIGLVVLAGLGVMAAFRSGARGAYKVARQTQEVTRMGGLLTRALGTAAVIVGIQWAVVVFTTDPRAWGVALGVPALFAGSVIARLFTVTDIVPTGKGAR
jgi:uncharacterized oligopeptide transporter (OPT) family protein